MSTTTTNEVNAINKINADKLGSFEIEDLRIRGYLAFFIVSQNLQNTDNVADIADQLLSIEKIKEYCKNEIWSEKWVELCTWLTENEKEEIKNIFKKKEV